MKQIHIYTDGACSGNPGPGGAAFVIVDAETGVYTSSACGFARTTNNRMEIMAADLALNRVLGMSVLPESVTVHTDSQLVVGTMVKGWKTKEAKLLPLWDALRSTVAALAAKGVKVTFDKVSGHAGVEFNEMADRLAVEASHGAVPNRDLPDEDAEKAAEPTLFDEVPAAGDGVLRETCAAPRPTAASTMSLPRCSPPAVRPPRLPSRESRYVVVQWPDIQFLMEKPGFREHAYLINDDRGMADFGSSAYFVEEAWLNENA